MSKYCHHCDEHLSFDTITCPACDEPVVNYDDYCQARWEQQQEDNAAEPPMSADERHQEAWLARDSLRRGYPR